MKTLLALLCCLAIGDGVTRGQEGADVPDTAKWEIARRGNFVQAITDEKFATIEQVAADQLSEALATPPDDSHKWYITLITADNCAPCEKLKKDFNEAKELQAWIKAAHYQVRHENDATQQAWIKGVRKSLETNGFPAVVIQPPRNGKFGSNKTVVAVLHGYDGDPAKFSDRMRNAVLFYLENRIRESDIKEGIQQRPGGYPPFKNPAPAPNPDNDNPQDFPPPLNYSKALSYPQIKAIVPDAPTDFYLSQLALEVKTEKEVTANWQTFRNEMIIKQKEVELDKKMKELDRRLGGDNADDENFTEPLVTTNEMLLAGAVIVSLILVVIGGAILWLTRKTNNSVSTPQYQQPKTETVSPLSEIQLSELAKRVAQMSQTVKQSEIE